MTVGAYFLGVVSFSVALNLIGMMYPNDKNGIRRALDACLSLCLLCAVIAPIGGMISDAKKDFFASDFSFELPLDDLSESHNLMAMLARKSEEDIEEKLYDILSSEMDEECFDIEVSAAADDDGVRIEHIRIYLYGRGIMMDPRKVREVVARYTDAECSIIEGRR